MLAMLARKRALHKAKSDGEEEARNRSRQERSFLKDLTGNTSNKKKGGSDEDSDDDSSSSDGSSGSDSDNIIVKKRKARPNKNKKPSGQTIGRRKHRQPLLGLPRKRGPH